VQKILSQAFFRRDAVLFKALAVAHVLSLSEKKK
jgi:hypothetical protein